MKKSQVLAALALAFALGLGVVAPVANTYAEGGEDTSTETTPGADDSEGTGTPGAGTEGGDTNEDAEEIKATRGEVEKAFATVESNAT